MVIFIIITFLVFFVKNEYTRLMTHKYITCFFSLSTFKM